MSVPTHNQDQSLAPLPPESVSPVSTMMDTIEIEQRLDDAPSILNRPSSQPLGVPVATSFRPALSTSEASVISHAAVPHDVSIRHLLALESIGLDYHQDVYPSEVSNTDTSTQEAAGETLAEETGTVLSDQDQQQPLVLAGEAGSGESNEASASLLCAEQELIVIPSRGSTEEELPAQKYWQPFCLRREVLLSLSTTFLMCLLATALLYSLSQKNKGLSAEDESRHYAWKYGPTAVLTVILYLWYSIDLSIRSLLPWQELQKGPRPAEVTLLLDYISPILTTSLWRASKNRHWAVVLTITGRLLISLAIAFSTALFVLAPTSVTIDNVSFNIPKATRAFKLDDVGPFAADMYYGVNFGNLDSPMGTFANAYVPLIQSRANDKIGRIPSNAVLEATVPGLRFDAGCEVVDIHNFRSAIDFRPRAGSRMHPPDTILIANITTPSCQINEVPIGYTLDTGDDMNFVQAIVSDYSCNNERSYYEAQFGLHPLANLSSAEWSNASSEHRILLTVANLSVSGTSGFYEAALLNLTALLCKPTYTLTDYQLQYDQGNQTAEIQLPGTSKGATQDLPGFTPQSLFGSSVLRAVNQASTVGEWTSQDPFFSLLKLKSNNPPLTRFFDSDFLKDNFKKVFEGVAAQFAHQLLLDVPNENKEVKGTATFTQNRLQVTKLSTGMLITVFGILAIISVALIPLAPRNVVILEPGSVLATALSLELAVDTWSIIQGLGHLRDKSIHHALSIYSFALAGTNVQERCKLQIETSKRAQATPSTATTNSKTELQWWGPLGSQSWFLIVSFAIPLVLIGLLEYFQKLSDDDDGFVRVQSRWGQLAANYLPAIVSILIGAMFSSIVAASSAFAPYSDLTKRPTLSSRSVALNYMSQTGPRLEYSALKNKHFGLSIITLAQLIASVLTIVLSGLYSMEEVKFRHDILVEPLDQFNITGTIINNSNPRAGLLTKLITYYGMASPGWTYDSIVLPRITVTNSSALDGIHSPTIKSTLPGLRGRLNCTALPLKDSKLSIDTPGYDQVVSVPGQSPTLENTNGNAPNGMDISLSIDRNLSASSLCNDAGAYGDSNFIWEERLFIASGSTPTPFGKVTQLRWPSLASLSNQDDTLNVEKRVSTLGTTDSTDGCPTIGIVLGQVTVDALHNDTSNVITNNTTLRNHKKDETEIHWRVTDADIGTLICWPKVDEIDVDVTFSWPSFDILEHPPPRIDESNTREVRIPTTGSTTWKWDNEISGINKYDPWVALKNTNDVQTELGLLQNHTNLDPFILALIAGKDQVPLEQILGENNTRVLEHHLQALWQRYMAQSISQNLRVDKNDASSTASSSHAITPQGHAQPQAHSKRSPVLAYPAEAEGIQMTRRLKQNASSKVALQVMLGIMSLSVVLMRLLSKSSKVLPHNPCSIAGTLSLVVDGNLRDLPLVIPERRRRGKKQRRRYMRLHSSKTTSEDKEGAEQKFIMGWWSDGDTRKFGVRYIEDAEES